jgi:hypothetical protein
LKAVPSGTTAAPKWAVMSSTTPRVTKFGIFSTPSLVSPFAWTKSLFLRQL